MVGFSSLLPQHSGLLPHFLVWQGLAATIHTVVCYVRSPTAALRQFSGPEAPRPHLLLSHVYGVKSMYTSAIRFYAAYHITNAQVYDLAVVSFAGVLFLYITEVFVYRTARIQEAVFTYLFAGTGLAWMVVQRDWYLSP